MRLSMHTGGRRFRCLVCAAYCRRRVCNVISAQTPALQGTWDAATTTARHCSALRRKPSDVGRIDVQLAPFDAYFHAPSPRVPRLNRPRRLQCVTDGLFLICAIYVSRDHRFPLVVRLEGGSVSPVDFCAPDASWSSNINPNVTARC